MPESRDKTAAQLDAAATEVAELLGLVREGFYGGVASRLYYRDRKMLVHALTWPAAWLGDKGLLISSVRYRDIVTARLIDIRAHGDWRKHQAFFPRYLLKCLQDHFLHHGDRLYEDLKHVSHAIDRILSQVKPGHEEAPINILAECHRITKPAPRRKSAKKAPQTSVDDSQQLLF